MQASMGVGKGGVTLFERLSDNCTPLGTVYPWNDDSGKKPWRYTQLIGGGDLATGTFDLATRRGSVQGKGDAIKLDSFADKRSVHIADFGLELAPGAVFVTARFRRAVSGFAQAAARVRIARIAHPKLLSGPAHDTKGNDYPDSFLIAVQGNATVLPAFAKAVNRIRCRGKRYVSAPNGRIKAGMPFGLVTVQLAPDAATGLDGTLELGGIEAESDFGDGPVPAIAATGGATASTRQGRVKLVFGIAPGTRTPVTCRSGYSCAPSPGASVPIVGGFTVTLGSRTAAVGDIIASWAMDSNGVNRATLAGTLDGAPVTIGVNGGFSDDFLARLSAALAANVRIFGGEPLTSFTKTTAPG